MIIVDSKSHTGGDQFGPARPQPGVSFQAPLLPPPPPPSYPRFQRPARPTSPANRFCKAFSLALVLYILLFTAARAIFYMAGRHVHDDVGIPMPEDGNVVESIGHLDWRSHSAHPDWAPKFPKSAEASFVLPVASHELYLISRGAYQSGKLTVTQSAQQGHDVRVDVRVAYHDERALARASVCRLHKGGNRDGVGIFTPTPGWSHSSRDRLLFDVVVTFPAASLANVPLRIHHLTVLTSNFMHEISDVWRSLLFDSVELDTSNSPIHIQSLTLTEGSLTSSNAPITGHLNLSDSLSLRTSNAAIHVTASLLSANRDATKLDMRTSNSPITAAVSLITRSGAGGDFAVKARSSNGAVKLQYEDAPLGGRLVSEAHTSNGVASVGLHPTFEGTYEVTTSNSLPVVVDTHPVDPTGRGRRRVVDQAVSRGTVSGRVFWGSRGGGESTCVVRTSNGRATLDV